MKLISLGQVLKPHGYTGAFLTRSSSGADAAFKDLESLFVGPTPERAKSYPIEEAAWMPKGWKLKLKGIETEAQVKEMVGYELYADRTALPPPDENEYYVNDLVGVPVFDASSGKAIGTFLGVETFAVGQDRWWIKTDGDEIAIPATKRYIQRVVTPESDGGPAIWLQNLNDLA